MSLLIALAGLALAQEVEFETTAAVEAPPETAEVSLSAELGGAITTGNTQFYTLSGSLSAGTRWGQNGFGLQAGALTGRTVVDADGDGTLSDAERASGSTETARRLFGDARYDRFFGERNSLYVLGGALNDPFAGYDLRTHEQLGYSRVIAKSETTELVGEIGLDYAQEKYVSGIDPGYQDVIAGRAMAGFSHKFSDSVAFSEQIEFYENLLDRSDLRVLNNAAITAKLSEALGLKISHQLTFDNVPVQGFRSVDQTTMATVVATIL